ncbi:28 kDa heat- and acid-stable phosphoprotein isoform X1 [Cygnus olor]|uniref:28 kDa heat- and acid-stable phosphoprotein isoform X1 n=1 Tax=Cygnus olor TaxID=8869 RepID=UPI001ADEBCC9|nr:28 kDa heat- and acid-stable phosphoprotein isoform X1 [Cygnus olor]
MEAPFDELLSSRSDSRSFCPIGSLVSLGTASAQGGAEEASWAAELLAGSCWEPLPRHERAGIPAGEGTGAGLGLGTARQPGRGSREATGFTEGRKGGHKGRARQYTSPEEIDAQLQAEKQKAREEEEQEEGGEGATGDPKKEKKSLDSDESDEDDEDYQQKRKGVEGLIDIENPNRVIQTTKKVTQLDLDGPKELSRREREEIEKQKAKERYMKMHLAGKTEQAKADLARLAIIRKQREEAARKKEEERKAKDEAAMAGKRLQSLSLNK